MKFESAASAITPGAEVKDSPLMPYCVSGRLVEKWLRSQLTNKGFRLSPKRKHGETGVDIALPNQAEAGLPQRAQQHKIAWLRIAKAFPELEIWLVDRDRYKRTRWGDWVS
jgi:hypothetical protein